MAQFAQNPSTGEWLVNLGGGWMPAEVAENPSTGERAYRMGGGAWEITPSAQPAPPADVAPPPTRQDGGYGLRPLNPGERRENPDGSYSTEITATEYLPDGSVANFPTLWMGHSGPEELPIDRSMDAAAAYEAATGRQFPRFATVEDAVAAAIARTEGGGGTNTPLAVDPNPVLRAILGVDAPTPVMPVDPLAADTRNLRGRNAGPPVRQPSMGMPPMGAEVPVDLSTAGGDFEAGQLMLGMVPGGLDVLSGANKSSLDTSMPQPGQNPLVGGPGLMPPDVAAGVPGDGDFARMRAQMADEGTRQILDALPGIITRQAEIGTIPVNPAAQEVMNAEGFMDAVSAAARGLGDDPYGLLRTFILRSLPASAPGIGGALAGSAVAGPGGAAAGAGIGEFLTEGGISAADGVMQALKEAGVDPTNRAAVEAFVQANPEAMRGVAMDALQRAGIISATGAVSGGVSGLAARNIARGGRTGRQLAGDAAGALAIEPVMEGAGEALAGGSGADVVAEALGGAGQGAVQLGGQTIVEVIRQALSAPAQPQSAPPAPVAAPGAPDAPAAPVAAPVAAPAPVQPAPVQPGQELAPPPPGANPAAPPAPSERGANPPEIFALSAPENPPDVGPAPIEPRIPSPEEEAEAQRIERAAAKLPTAQVASWVATLPSDRRAASSAARPATGIDPDGEIGRELKANGVTPQRFPRLFQKGGRRDLDNIPYSQLPEGFDQILKADEAGYVDRQDLIDAIIAEANKTPRLTSEQSELRRQAETVARRYQPDYDAPTRPDEPAPVSVGRYVVSDPNTDLAPPAERAAEVSRVVDEMLANEYPDFRLDPRERMQIEDNLFYRGGDADEAFNWWLIQNSEYVDGSPQETYAPLPFDVEDAPLFAGEDPASGGGRAGEARPQPGADQAREDGAGGAGRAEPGGGLQGPDDARPGPGAARTGTAEGGRVDLTREGQQLVIPGAEQITDKQRAERKMEQPKRGGDAPPPDGGLFSPKGPELFDDRADEGFSLSDAAAPKPAKPKSTGRQPQGSLTPSFLSMSFTDKNSVYEAAFRAAGMEPDKARLLPAARQIAILSKLLEDTYGVKIELPQITMQRKTVSGRKVEEKRPQISDRDAIDQMLDAFRQMQMMAHILGLPVGAVGLREGGVTGKGLILSLTRRLKGALGMYSYEPEGGARKITLPGRSNSFGHEWGHALDHFVHALFKGDWSKMLSRDIFKTGVTPASKSNQIAQAFTGVLQAMYGERAALAALQIDLTLRAAQLNKKGEQTAAAKKAQGYLNMIEAGAKLPPDAWSGYFTTSAQFDEAFGGGGYFTDPAEMFARAFEAYLGTKAAAMSGLPTSFLSKPDWAYNDSDETRASLTFPRGTDQIRVFAAIDRLMDEIREHGVFGGGRADKPEDADVYQSRVWDKMQPEGSLVQQERAARRRAKRTATAIERTHPLWKQGRDFVSFMTDTFGGFLHGLINRQPPQAQAALRNMVDLFVTDPGSGRLIKPVWEAAVQIITTRHVNRLENMVAAHKLEEYTEAETAQLRQVLTGAKIKVDPKIEKAAADLRRMMDELWRYLTEAGVKIGYARNGYLPRIMDRDAVMVNQAGFKTQAAKVYATMFRRDVRTAEMEDQITDVRGLLRQINADTEGTETGDRVATARLDPSDIDLIDNWKKALTKLNRLEKQAADLAKKGEEDKADALSEKIGEAREAFEALHADMLDMLERQWSAYAADKWLVGVLAKSAMDIGGNAPASGFTKKRELPAEADKLMADFYQGNPVTLIHDFIGAAARRAEWTRRVGEGGEKLNNMVEAAIKAGADSRDVEEIRHSINVLAGRVSNNGESFVHTVYGWFYTFTTMFLLKLAPLASLAEPMVAGLKTGRVRDSIRGLGLLLSQARKTGSAQDRRELARVIGLTRSAMNETVLQNRYGGELDPSQTQARLMSSFFQSIGLTGLTNASRHAMLPIGADHIRRMLMIDAGRRKGFFEVNAKTANEELNDLGIPKEHREALLDWLDSMDGRLPTVEDLIGVDGDYFNPAAAIWGPALLQFVDTAIQNTRKFDRPGAALRPGMGLIYGITGFIFSFHRNVLGRMLKQGVDARRPGEGRARAAVRQTAGAARNVARYAPAIGALVAGHTLASIFRDALFAPDGWEDAEEEDELTEWLLTRAWSRTGLMGAWDIPYNLITGLRYDRDLASAGVGPHIGVPLQAAQKFGNIWFGRNSENTNTTENRGVDALASLVLTGFGNMAISAIPGGPLTTAGKGAAIHGWTYLDPGQLVADALFPLDE